MFKKKDETEELEQQAKLAHQYARLDPSSLSSAVEESRQFQVSSFGYVRLSSVGLKA
jgi:hypothetical protein